MEEYVVYVLYSEKYNIHYTGYTGNLIARFASHNSLSEKGFTKKYRPWAVVHVEFCNSKREAIVREKFLKRCAGRAFLKNLLSTV
ncbi:MAG: GIY-YIG nuclease family protein [Flavobacteriia bacterium]|nr:GIY-YIG nuclease family protein [Flavobacteriia bacterium]MBH2023450.1 GIY-YIG nuclease family protein [Flavobacteriales bacterium]